VTAKQSRRKRSGSRFDFGSDDIGSTEQTGTLNELLEGINVDRGLDVPGRMVTIHSLRHVLPLLSRISGRKYKSTTEVLPMTTLKTIKLLYTENRLLNQKQSKVASLHEQGIGEVPKVKGTHLINLIGIPTNTKASMESATGTTVTRDSRGRETIERLCSKLALEIPPDRLKLSNLFFSASKTRAPAEGVIAYIEHTNDAVYRDLTDSISGDPKALGSKFKDLAKFIYNMPSYGIREDAKPTPLHEQLYVHLQSLGFIHYAIHQQEFVKNVKIKASGKPPTRAEITSLFMTLCHAIGDDATPDSQSFCANDVCQVIDKHSEHIKNLVEKVTGLPTRRQGLMEDAPRAVIILRSYAYRCFDKTSPSEPILSLHDIVAALCSFRYQQSERTPYQPKWPSQEASEGRATKAHFDKGLKITSSNTKPHIFQGVFLIYYDRFAQYKAAFDRTTPVYQGWMAFQYARLHAYIGILKLRDIYRFSLAACYFDELCTEEARSVTKDYESRSLM
jgi:hypothetical protein